MCVPQTHRRGAGGRYGAVQFQLFGPAPTDWLNYVRTIVAANDGGRWVFETHGEVQPFERPEAYTTGRIADRFTAEMLGEYAAALGVRYFDPEFYGLDGLLFHVEERGASGVTIPSMSLEEAQAKLGIRRAPLQ
jgi:hypothetical protein